MKNQLTINIRPTPKQKVGWKYLKDNITEFIFFGGGAGGGKSWQGCEWLLVMCIVYPGFRGFIGRNELKRIMSSTYVTWKKVCKWHKIPDDIWKLNSQHNYIEFINFQTKKFDGYGSRIDLLDVAYLPRDPLYERFGSIEFTSGFAEEVGEWHEKAFDVLKSRIGRHKPDNFTGIPKIFLTGNPKKNWTYYSFYLPWRDTKKPEDNNRFDMVIEGEVFNCVFIQSLYRDNPYTMVTYERQLKSIRDKVLRQRLKDGNWEYEDDDANLMEYENIIKIFSESGLFDAAGDMYLSVDVARSGNDKAVIILWQGLHIKKLWYEDKTNIKWFRLKIEKLCEQHQVPLEHVVIDEDNMGGGLVDELEYCVGFVNGSKAVEAFDEDMQETDRYSYLNLRSQCYFKLAEMVDNGKITCYQDVPTDIRNDIIQELEVIKRKDHEKNEKKLQVIPKDEIKAIIGRSPDYADAMMMRMIFELGLQANQDISVVW